MDIPTLGNSRELFVAGAFGESTGNRKDTVQISFGVPVYIDEHGFRVDPDQTDSDADEALLLLGDSVAFGPGVEEGDTLAGRLRRSLASVRLYNSAVIGYATSDYANVAEQFIPEHLEVRHAWLLFCLNDVSTTNARQIQRSLVPEDGREGIERFRGTILDSLNSFLRSRSELYIFLKSRLTDPRMRYFQADRASYLGSNQSFEVGMRPLLRVRDVLAQHEVSLTVVVLPYAAQLRTQPPSQTEPQERIVAFLAENGITHLDTTPFLAEEQEDLFLFGDPMHLSKAGHRALFELLRTRLLEDGGQGDVSVTGDKRAVEPRSGRVQSARAGWSNNLNLPQRRVSVD